MSLVLAAVAAVVLMAVTATSAFAAIPIPPAGAEGLANTAVETPAPVEVVCQLDEESRCVNFLQPPVPGVAVGKPGPL